MTKHRAARWVAGLLIAGGLAAGAFIPAQADTGWNGTTGAVVKQSQTKPADTGWNGT